MRGMDRNTGKAMDGRAHLLQSITDIYTTIRQTRTMRRWYGIDGELIDRPASSESLGAWAYEVADALQRAQETRYVLNSIQILKVDALGRLTIRLIGEDKEGGGAFELDGLIWH